ncbi:mitogen-activated protein kinase kinase kinase [Striga asiatica]|uniref:Mitogen-activated protein kinase kinase kinase n=1 Tax=Striga asiatica TaxID=4170 RepID=A0A5A7QGV0_STRAF|nr:mitogen-activated protein kinase kinase kinase [Striga asiatica]
MDLIIGHVIGHGSSGAVVSTATSISSGEILAVKSADLRRSQALRREEKILSTLNHPNIIGHRGCHVSIEGRRPVFRLVMEYAPGGTLADASSLDEPTIARHARAIVDGLDYLHSRGIVHCDIKGSNVLIKDGEAKIADFGCAKLADDVVAVIGGTPLYMSPEVVRGEEQSFAADVWALGCTVIEMATGGRPPWRPNDASTLAKIAFSGETPEVPEFLSGSARDFIGRCLRVDPRERWTAGKLAGHPFVAAFGFGFGQAKEVTGRTCSPTSVLDRGIWGSAEEGFSEDLSSEPVERIRELCVESFVKEDWECEEGWITVRDCENVRKIGGIKCGDEFREWSFEFCGNFSLQRETGENRGVR